MNNVQNQRKKKQAKKKIAKKKTKQVEAKPPKTGGFPKIVTDAKIQTVTYDATSGANIKFKEFTMTSGQLEKLTAIAMDGRARVRLSIEEINPPFDAAAAQGTSRPDPMFTDMSDKKAGKKTQKKTDKKTDGKKGKDTDDGSQLPI